MAKNVKKYPNQVKIRQKLTRGDRLKVAEATGYKEGTIREMLKGFRRMTDPVKQAIINIVNERAELDRKLEEIAKQ
ncbi:MAG: hypothetical protein RBR40_08460 [Tenuifilaceae bacterium]|jgi:hypothetical protein|nr:hypothetical protein [Bacteroidales bacterium]MDY0201006.1 hypothetical protein [Tenuifilaceae bacterium]